MRIFEQIFKYIRLSKNLRMNIRIYSYWGNGTNTNTNNIQGPFYLNIRIFKYSWSSLNCFLFTGNCFTIFTVYRTLLYTLYCVKEIAIHCLLLKGTWGFIHLSILLLWHLFKHHFSIMRPKSKHHENPMIPKLWPHWFLMMPTFGSNDAKMML